MTKNATLNVGGRMYVHLIFYEGNPKTRLAYEAHTQACVPLTLTFSSFSLLSYLLPCVCTC